MNFFMFVINCFIYLGAPILGAQIFTIVRSSCWVVPFIYLFMVERERERQREKQAPCREPDTRLDPGTPGSCPEPKADA